MVKNRIFFSQQHSAMKNKCWQVEKMKTDIMVSANINRNSKVYHITWRFKISHAERAWPLVSIWRNLDSETYQKTPIIRRYYRYGLVRCFSISFPTFTTRNNPLDEIPERGESPKSRGVYLYLHVGKSLNHLHFTSPSTAEYPSLCQVRLSLRRTVWISSL